MRPKLVKATSGLKQGFSRGAVTLSRMVFSLMALSIIAINMFINLNDTQHYIMHGNGICIVIMKVALPNVLAHD